MRRKPSNTPRPSRVIRCFLWLSALILLFYLAGKSIRQHGGPVSVPEILGGWGGTRNGQDEQEYEMVGQDNLPDFPTPIVVTDRRGRAKWTVSIPPNYEFPLAPREYADMCAKCREVSSRVGRMHSHSPMTAAIDQITLLGSGAAAAASSQDHDRYFLDVRDAERQGFLPGDRSSKGSSGRGGALLGVDGNSLDDKTVCKSSLTFVLESDDAGLGKTLMALWMAYGLAKREGRAFFIEDTRWAYGAYSSMFEKPPQPSCRPPPRHERLPCPRQARHLVISTAANARDVFGGHIDADDIYAEGPAAQTLQHRPGQRELYALAREGYNALFKLTPQDREYVFNRVHEHKIKTYAVDGAAHNGRMVGVHVRHGDRHPLEFQYADSYIPLTEYVDAARELLNASLLQQQQDDGGHIPNDNDHTIARQKSFLVVASDDPLVYDAAEFTASGLPTVRAQELIRLAGKEEVGGEAQKKQPKNVMHKFTDETFGWEGGFFAAMFWNLGRPSRTAISSSSTSAADAHHSVVNTPSPPSAETIRLRSLVGRAYLMDLAALSAMTEGGGVVCAVSAMGCRILAVMMGEDRAFGRGEWKNVDGGFGWNGFTW